MRIKFSSSSKLSKTSFHTDYHIVFQIHYTRLDLDQMIRLRSRLRSRSGEDPNALAT